MKKYEELSERHTIEVQTLEKHIKKLQTSFYDLALQKDRELCDYNELLSIESNVKDTIIDKQSKIIEESKEYIL